MIIKYLKHSNSFKMIVPKNVILNPTNKESILSMNAFSLLNIKHQEQQYDNINITHIDFKETQIKHIYNLFDDDEYIVNNNNDELKYIFTNYDNEKHINISLSLDIQTDLNEEVGYCIQNIDIHCERR